MPIKQWYETLFDNYPKQKKILKYWWLLKSESLIKLSEEI